jgi:hypothetical protein
MAEDGEDLGTRCWGALGVVFGAALGVGSFSELEDSGADIYEVAGG